MKKLAVCLALLLTLAACAPAAGTVAAPTPSPTPEPDFTVGELYELPDTIAQQRGCNTGDAYYEMIDLLPRHGGELVIKTDYATGVQSCVCQIPGCAHDSSSCPAYLPVSGFTQLFVVDGTVYLSYSAGLPQYRQAPMTQAEVDAEAETVLAQPNAAEIMGGMSAEEYRRYRREEATMRS